MPFDSFEAVDQRLTQNAAPLTDQEILDLYPWMQQLSTGATRRLQAELSLRTVKTIKDFDENSGKAAKWGLWLNIALLVLTVVATWIAIKSYRDADRSSKEQEKTLEASREALEEVLTTASDQQRLLQQSVDVSTKQLGIITAQQQREMRQPDVHAVLLYPQRPSILLVDQSESKTARQASFEPRFRNLSHKISDTAFDLYGGKSVSCDYISPQTSCGPFQLEFPGKAIFVAGDELFGLVTVSCPDCAAFRTYWVYISFPKDGVFAEGKATDYDFYHLTPQNARSTVEKFLKRKDLVRMPTKWP